MGQPRHRIEMRRYAIVNAVLAAMAALVLALHEDPSAPVPPGPSGTAGGPARGGGSEDAAAVRTRSTHRIDVEALE